MAMPPIYVYKIEGEESPLFRNPSERRTDLFSSAATTDAANVMPAVWQDWYSKLWYRFD